MALSAGLRDGVEVSPDMSDVHARERGGANAARGAEEPFARGRYLAALLAAVVVNCLPILSTTYFPLVDFPNHLARAYVLDAYARVPVFQATYIRLFEPIPDLASDLVIVALLKFVGPLAAAKLFMLLTALLFFAGCHLLGKAIHGRPTWLALPCCFFFYNSMLFYGFVSYVFGVAVFCVALACWLKWRGRWTAARYSAVVLLVFAAYLSHLAAYCFVGVAFVFVEAWDYFRRRVSLQAAVVDLLHLVPSLLAFFLFMRGSGEVGAVEWNSVKGKLIGALPLFLSYNYKLDACLIAALLVVAGLTLWRVRRVGVAGQTFALGVLFFALYLVCPKVLFTSSGADARFVLPAGILLLLSLRIKSDARAGAALMLACLALLVVRLGEVWAAWGALDRRAAAQVKLMDAIPTGARVYPVFVMPEERQKGKLDRAFAHAPLYATINRQAIVPTLFTRKGRVALVSRAKACYAEPPDGYAAQWLSMSGEWTRCLGQYDYLWAYGLSGELRGLISNRADLVYDSDGFTLWRLREQSNDARSGA